MAVTSSFAVFVAIVTIACSILFSLLERYVIRPWLIVCRLRAQAIPGLPFRPFVGNLPEFFSAEKRRNKDPDVASSTRALEQMFDGTRKFGKIWFWSSGFLPRIVITDPTLIRQMFLSKNTNFVKPDTLKKMKLIQNGLVAIDGEEWASQRRLVTPAFHFVELRRLFNTMIIHTKEALKDWEKAVKSNPLEPLNMDRELSKLTLQIICSTAFGTSFGEEDKDELRKIQDAFETSLKVTAKNRIMSSMVPFYRHLPIADNRRLWAAEEMIVSTMRRIVKRREGKVSNGKAFSEGKDESSSTDLLQLMLDSREGTGYEELIGPYGDGEATNSCDEKAANKADENAGPRGSPGQRMTEQQLIDECITFMGAGHETTATLLTWTMVLLSQNPEWQERARKEVLELRGDVPLEKWIPTFDQVSQLKTVTWILQETLRMFPPAAALARTCVADTVVTEHLTIPAGCDVMAPIEVLHYTDEYWRSNPLIFSPERFQEGAAKATSQPGAYIPFGLGPRVCIGQNFAMIEGKLILAMLLSRFSWKTAEAYRHHPSIVMTMKPKHGLPIILSPLYD